MQILKDKIVFDCKEQYESLPLLHANSLGGQGCIYPFRGQVLKIFAEGYFTPQVDQYQYFLKQQQEDFAFPLQLAYCQDEFVGYTMPKYQNLDLLRKPYLDTFSKLKTLLKRQENSVGYLNEQKIKMDDLDLCNVIYDQYFRMIDLDSYQHAFSFTIKECQDHNESRLRLFTVALLRTSLVLKDIPKYQGRLLRYDKRLLNGDISQSEYVDVVRRRISEDLGTNIQSVQNAQKQLRKTFSKKA